VGHPLWREDGSVFCLCCWPLPAQSFSGPSPLGLVTVFYCLRIETSLFVASYDSQGHGGGIRTYLHTGSSQTELRWILYPLGMDHAQKTELCTVALSRPHRKHNSVLLRVVTCLPSRCLETGCITPLFYYCVRVLLSNASFCGSTVLGVNTSQ
jgi:hypothetical protein